MEDRAGTGNLLELMRKSNCKFQINGPVKPDVHKPQKSRNKHRQPRYPLL